MIDTATAAVAAIAAGRFHRPVATPAAGPVVSPQSPLSISCIHGLCSGSLSSACVTMRSTETATSRRRRIGLGGSERCFARIASRVGAWNGGTPQNISYTMTAKT